MNSSYTTQTIHFHGPAEGVVIGDNNTVTFEYVNGYRETVPFLAPPLPGHSLIGRDELLEELKFQLLKGGNTLSVLNGIPGVGKTVLAAALAHDKELLKHFPGGVLWAGLGPQFNPLGKLGLWMRALDIPDEEIVNARTCEARKRYIQSKIGNRRILVVIDDVWTLEDAQWFRLGGPNCGHLLTTRQPEIASDFSGTEGSEIKLTELNQKDSLTLLREFVKDVVEKELKAAEKLVMAVGRLPIALVLMGKYLQNQPSENIKQALEYLLDREKRLNQEQLPSSLQLQPGISEASISLYTVIAKTEDALDEKTRAMLRRLGVFPSSPGTFSEKAVLEVTGLSPLSFDLLYKYGILEIAGGGRYLLHQTISDYTILKLSKIPQEEKKAKLKHCEFFANFINSQEKNLKDSTPQKALNLLDPDMANIELMWNRSLEQKQQLFIRQASQGIERFYWLRGLYQKGQNAFSQAMDVFDNQNDGYAQDEEYWLMVSKLGLFQGKFLQVQNFYQEAEPLYERALEIQKRILGVENLEVATSSNELGSLYEAQGLYDKAEFLYQKCLDIRNEKLQSKHPDVARALNDMARLCQHQGRYEKAEELFHQALEIRESLGTERLDMASSYNNLAIFYRTQENNGEAESFYQKALKIWKNVLGEENLYVATTLGNLGELYQAQGRYSEAETLYRQTLDIRKKILGSNHLDVAQSYHNMGLLARMEEKYNDAERNYKQAIAIRAKFLGPNNPDVAISLSNLAESYRIRGQYNKAERLGTRALEIREAILDLTHLDIATSLNNLALVYYELGEYAKAENFYSRALDIQKSVFGGMNHPTIAKLLDNLASLYHVQGQYSEAERLYQQALDIRKRHSDFTNPDIARSLINLARLYNERKQYADAKQYYHDALNRLELLEKKAAQYYSQKEYAAAESCYRQALIIKEDTLGAEHPEIAMLLNNLALLYKSQGRNNAAEPLYQRSIKILEQAFGPQHPSVATLLHNLALLYYSQEKYQSTESLLTQEYTILKKSFGTNYPQTIEISEQIAALHEMMQKNRS